MKRIMPEWTSLIDIKLTLEKKWQSGLFLREMIEPKDIFPYKISLKTPTSSELSSRFDEARDWTSQYISADRRQPFTVEWIDINHRILGSNRLPVALHFDSSISVAQYIGKTKEHNLFLKASSELCVSFPALKQWIIKYPFTLLECAPDLENLIRIAIWMIRNPLPRIYLRQLSLDGIDTKFIESYKKTLGDWLDILLDPSSVRKEYSGIKSFEKRFGFLTKPDLVRFRILDEQMYINGLSDITARADEFCARDIDADTVFITENDINGLAFPKVKKAIVVFGRGYGFESLKDAVWLKTKKIFYWGDIDTHGFAILSQFRGIFPQTASLLMDRDTFMMHRDLWVQENCPSSARLDNLTDGELSLYTDLQKNRIGNSLRLEQEFVRFEALKKALQSLT